MIAQRMDDLSLSLPRWAFVPLRDFYIAFAIVCTLSSALAVAQALFGWYPFRVWLDYQAPGLFFNPVHAGLTLAIMIVALVANRLYWFIPALAPGLYLAHSRGAWAALGIGLLAARFRNPLWLLVLVLALGVAYSLYPNSSDLQRLQIWRAAWINLTLWGHGPDSFLNMYIAGPAGAVQPQFVHNDYLQTVFEYGVLALIPFTAIAYAAAHTSARDWPTLITFLFMATFSFPMHMPLILAIGTVAFITTILGEVDA